jgi:hypothetical protein
MITFFVIYGIVGFISFICILYRTRVFVTSSDYVRQDEISIPTWIVGSLFTGMVFWPLWVLYEVVTFLELAAKL